MPVQINEMIIRANIVEPNDKTVNGNNTADSNVSKYEIIRECNEIILEIIKNKKER
jgi:hypothetical protein